MTRQQTDAINFFRANQHQYATPPGAVACAAHLARAEAQARTRGWGFIWDRDPDNHDEYVVLLTDSNDKVLDGMGGIDPAYQGNAADRRVVEAELAAGYLYATGERPAFPRN